MQLRDGAAEVEGIIESCTKTLEAMIRKIICQDLDYDNEIVLLTQRTVHTIRTSSEAYAFHRSIRSYAVAAQRSNIADDANEEHVI